ncbi:MAG: serine hydrolase domain-containing protein, partial [Bacteroidia bacterium]
MLNKIILSVVVISSFCACNYNKKSQKSGDLLGEDKSAKIDSLVMRYHKLNRFSGTVLVAFKGELQYQKHFGLANYENKIPITSTTAFKVGEITELVTLNILKKLVDENKLEMSDSLSQFVQKVGIKASIGDLVNEKVDVSYNLIGELIEKVSKADYQKNIEDYAKSLGLEHTFFNDEDAVIATGYLYDNIDGKGLKLRKSSSYNLNDAFSSTGLKSTGSDLAKIVHAQTKNINIHGYLKNDGFSYALVHDAEKQLSIIILSNRKHPVANEIVIGVNAIINNKEYKMPLLRQPFKIDKSILPNFIGSYSLNPNMNFEVTLVNDRLFVTMGTNKIHLIPQAPNQFYITFSDASMRFITDSTGKVNSIKLLNGFIDSDQVAKRLP